MSPVSRGRMLLEMAGTNSAHSRIWCRIGTCARNQSRYARNSRVDISRNGLVRGRRMISYARTAIGVRRLGWEKLALAPR